MCVLVQAAITREESYCFRGKRDDTERRSIQALQENRISRSTLAHLDCHCSAGKRKRKAGEIQEEKETGNFQLKRLSLSLVSLLCCAAVLLAVAFWPCQPAPAHFIKADTSEVCDREKESHRLFGLDSAFMLFLLHHDTIQLSSSIERGGELGSRTTHISPRTLLAVLQRSSLENH